MADEQPVPASKKRNDPTSQLARGELVHAEVKPLDLSGIPTVIADGRRAGVIAEALAGRSAGTRFAGAEDAVQLLVSSLASTPTLVELALARDRLRRVRDRGGGGAGVARGWPAVARSGAEQVVLRRSGVRGRRA